jgi:hypothetical protein
MVTSFQAERTHYLGCKTPEPGAVKLKLHDYMDFGAIAVPRTFGHIDNRFAWGTLGNTRAGDCVVAGACHETADWTRAVNGVAAPFTENNALDIYRQQTGWDGVSGSSTDTGLDPVAFALHRRTVGIPDAAGNVHRIDGFAQVTSWDHAMAAAYVFGACAFCFQVPRSAMQQFRAGQPWLFVGDNSNEGGHYVPIVGRNSRGMAVAITWGDLQAIDQGFFQRYLILALAYISLEYIKKSTLLTPENLNLAQLEADLALLAGG